MRTDFPTVEIYFVFAFTYCKLRVYKKEEKLARRVLKAHNVEFLTGNENAGWEEIDTRVLLNLVKESLPKILSKSITETISSELRNFGGGSSATELSPSRWLSKNRRVSFEKLYKSLKI